MKIPLAPVCSSQKLTPMSFCPNVSRGSPWVLSSSWFLTGICLQVIIFSLSRAKHSKAPICTQMQINKETSKKRKPTNLKERTNPSTVTTDISNATSNRISANFFTLGFGKTSKTSKAASYLTNLSVTCPFTVHLQAIAPMIKLNKFWLHSNLIQENKKKQNLQLKLKSCGTQPTHNWSFYLQQKFIACIKIESSSNPVYVNQYWKAYWRIALPQAMVTARLESWKTESRACVPPGGSKYAKKKEVYFPFLLRFSI